MAEDVDLEIGLSWDRQNDAVRSYLRVDRKDSNQDNWAQPEDPLAIDFKTLRSVDANPDAYGTALTEMLLGHREISEAYQVARQATQGNGGVLHVRLHISGPAHLHAVHWELLQDPKSGHRIALGSDVLFSRYLSGADWRLIPTRPKHALRGLIAVSAPSDIDIWGEGKLAPVDREGELARARSALEQCNTVRELESGEVGLGPMLSALEEEIDVLYLVCHGMLRDGVPQLYLERDNGETDVIDGRTLVERLDQLDHRPTVVMLCSCQSAARGDELWTADDGELSALGPRLASAGVAAVVAMQGNFSMESAEAFGPKFFAELNKHGQVDRSMAAARRAIQDRPDWWVPVLFSRLRSGRTYYRPQFADKADDTWGALETAMEMKVLTPVLGPGLADSILMSRQGMASRWVERWQMPLTTHARGDLAQVAQYLRVRSADGNVRNQLLRHLINEMSDRRDQSAEGDPFWGLEFDVDTLHSAILEVGRRLRESDPDDPYRVAAAIPAKVYVTTGWTDLLQQALISVGRTPDTRRFRWNEPIDPPAGKPEPTVEKPLVYHLFGHLEDPRSLVLSEDDYFAWFTAWLQKGADVPHEVQTALVMRSLLFLGFRLDDWDFRVVFHAIKSFGGSALLQENQHAGVQLSPDESPLIEPEAAQEYLESYFGKDKVDIFWGETREFLTEFCMRTGLQT